VLKQMQVMHRKGLLVRSEGCRSHTYVPAFERSVTQHQLVAAVLQLAFDGSAPRLVRSALEGRRVGAKELEEIREFLREFDK
jgi:predicted transcriptional regulator